MAAAKIYDMDSSSDDELNSYGAQSLEAYVLDLVECWSKDLETNYLKNWDEYYRLWRGIWAEEDKTRESERSRIVTPALQQAVESAVADIEEATFSQGQLFDIRDDVEDQNPQDIAMMRKKLTADFNKQKIRKEVCDVLLNAAVFGTGIAEIVMEDGKDVVPASEPIMDGQMQAVGVNIKDRVYVKMRSINPRNFRIDPAARTIDEAHGVAIDEFISTHAIEELQEKGVYLSGSVGGAAYDNNIEADPEKDTVESEGRTRITKYFGKVPRHLLEAAQKGPDEDEEVVDLLFDSESDDSKREDGKSYYVEAVVILANEGQTLLKVEENPYMMQDRPVVAFAWDTIPGIFWGRGVCEKGYNSQKALDAEIRARIDALALTVHPVMAIDATRIPRGHKPEIRPGKTILTNGNPREILNPFTFGSVDQITFAQAAELQKMLQQATGAVDGAGMQEIGSNNKTGAVSMALGSVIKRQKRTLVSFQDCFWIPFIEKAAWRYMQFAQEQYPVQDFKFIATGSLGTMGREYQVAQLSQLMQTMDSQHPMYPALVKSIVESMSLTNRDQLVEILDKAAQPNPEAQQQAQEVHAKQMALQDAQINAVTAQANEGNSRAAKYAEETRLLPQELEISKLSAITKNIHTGEGDDKEFERRLKIADLKLREKAEQTKEKDMAIKHLMAKRQMDDDSALKQAMSKPPAPQA